MDTNKEWKNILESKMYIGVPASRDAGDKLALISMICYLTNALKQKTPDLDHYKVIRLCIKGKVISDEQIESTALTCDWFAHQCNKFPDLGIKPKDMPSKICELMMSMFPF